MLLQRPTDHIARVSTYKKRGKSKTTLPCTGCGSSDHASFQRETVCPAWGKQCLNCQKSNHFASVCRYRKQDTASALIAHVRLDEKSGKLSPVSTDIIEIPADVSVHKSRMSPVKVDIFPDSGASICLAGPEFLSSLNIDRGNLIRCSKTVTAVGGSKLCCDGWLPILFQIDNKRSVQPVFICDKVNRVYFSRKGCQEMDIISQDFPFPMQGSDRSRNKSVACADKADLGQAKCKSVSDGKSSVRSVIKGDNSEEVQSKSLYSSVSVPVVNRPSDVDPRVPNCPSDVDPRGPNCPSVVDPRGPNDTTRGSAQIPDRPSIIPYEPTVENVPKLKDFIVKAFEKTAFNNSARLIPMVTKPVSIHLKDDALPYACHVPIPVPHHWKDEIKKSIDSDVANGIIEPVPVGEPVKWCAQMVVVQKKDGRPRRTVDLQKLNSQCMRETHHCASPFNQACQVPSNTKKTVLDAADGFHSVPLEENSKPLTTFITEWGRYRYCRLPQGYLAASDAYTRRYDDIIEEVPDKIKVVDDTLLYDNSIESAFWHTWDYISLCYQNGITFNKDKFQFCQDDVEFSGLLLTNNGIRPTEKILSAIKNFPKPTSLTDARSWFGLVNQVAWAYSTSPVMQPFRDLVKPNAKFFWDANLDEIFTKSKDVLIDQVTEGIRKFDIGRPTFLQTDWCREGIGYLLLQKHCQCQDEKAPTCCKDGLKLVFAGSRFTRGAETGYASTEGECLAVSWSLHHARLFLLGCKSLTVVTDHKPLLGILKDKDLSDIKNPRILNLKEKTFGFDFKIQHSPGKWNRAADAMSRNPDKACTTPNHDIIAAIFHTDLDSHNPICEPSDVCMVGYVCEDKSVTLSDVQRAGAQDPAYKQLKVTVHVGFPPCKNDLPASLKVFWNVRNRLSVEDDILYLDSCRVVIPKSLIRTVLKFLHSAHQGVNGMSLRANNQFYWPGMYNDIHNTRFNCTRCNENSPLPSKEPLIISKTPDYPFQCICLDYFEAGSHYLIVVDRFSGWLMIFHCPSGEMNGKSLVNICRDVCINYGVSEEVSSDGGPPFNSDRFQSFLRTWGIHHRLSSAYYPQSNGRAELGVKSARRILADNVSSTGSLDTDSVARAVLQYRNTPLPGIGLSPAQILFHRNLRDTLPCHPSHFQLHKEWVVSRKQLESKVLLSEEKLAEKYNASAHSLQPLSVGDHVLMYNLRTGKKGKWDSAGVIVEALPFRQYRIKVNVSGRVVLRNRRFLRKTKPSQQFESVISPASDSILQRGIGVPDVGSENDVDISDAPTAPVVIYNDPPIQKLPRALQCLQTFNNPGLKESVCKPSRR